MDTQVIQILDKPGHDQVVAQSKGIPTVIYVSNSVLPACKAFQPKYEELARKWSSKGIKFAQLEFTSATSMMFKFAPNQLPISVCTYSMSSRRPFALCAG